MTTIDDIKIFFTEINGSLDKNHVKQINYSTNIENYMDN